MLCLFVSSLSLRAQYSITAVAPPPTFTFNDLWHFTVLRGNADSYTQFYVSLRIMDGNNQLKVKSNSAVLTFPTGSSYYNAGNLADLQPFTSSYYDGGLLQQAIASGGMFPPGTYVFAYTLFGKSADGAFVPLSEDGGQATVEALWPPMLLSPPDGDTLPDAYPLLTWTPAFSSTYTGAITYTLKLVEVLPGQNGYQAIQGNPAHFTQQYIPGTALPYPPAGQALDTGKAYAWQVYADAGGASLGQSEIWVFYLHTDLPETPAPALAYYAILKAKPDAAVFLAKDNLLRFTYTDDYVLSETQQIRFVIYDERHKLLFDESHCNHCIVTRNSKYYTLNIGGGQQGISLDKNKIYYLEVRNDKGERRLLKFKKV